MKSPKEFKPVKLTVEFTTEDELRVFLAMCLTNDSVPRVTTANWGSIMPENGKTILKLMLQTMKNALEDNGFVRSNYKNS